MPPFSNMFLALQNKLETSLSSRGFRLQEIPFGLGKGNPYSDRYGTL
jgi:hypothetical protein